MTSTQNRVLGAIALLCLLLAGCGGLGKRPEANTSSGERPGDLYVNMAAAYLQRGQMDVALEHALRADKEDKRNPRTHYMLAIVYQRLGKKSLAEKHFSEAVKLDPGNPVYLNARGTILCLERRYKEATKQFELAAQDPLYKTPELALMNAADCSRRAGQRSKAESYLRKALSANPNYAPALLAMAKLSYDKGSYGEARSFLARYSHVGQVTPKALLLAHQIEVKLGNRKGAKALADSLRAGFPDAPEVMQL